MRNNLLSGQMEKSSDADERLLTYNDILELITVNKIQRGDFDEFVEEMISVLTPECCEAGDCCCCCCCDDYCPNGVVERRLPVQSENSSSQFLCAGYTDCMDEAIRYLVEVEKISPEQPMVRNLKAHLESSKKRILDGMTFVDSRSNAQNEWRPICQAEEDGFTSADQCSTDPKCGLPQEYSYHHRTNCDISRQLFPIYTKPQLATL